VQSDVIRLLSESARQAQPESDAANADLSRLDCSDYHILVVDDGEVNRETAAGLLTADGYRVTTAEDGQQAVDACLDDLFSLILMDCSMPLVDGFSATAMIREYETPEQSQNLQPEAPRQRTPIIAVTAHAMDGFREQCLAAGMDDYITKPFTPDGLKTTVTRWQSATSSAITRSEPPVASERPDDAKPEIAIENVTRDDAEFDPSVFDKIVAAAPAAGESLCQRLIQAYIDESGGRVTQIEAAYAGGEQRHLATEAHGLKSCAANVGLRQVLGWCTETEVNASSVTGEDIAMLRTLCSRGNSHLSTRASQFSST
jgi:two-component system sensor histidine kinase/response regulator